MVLDDNGFNHQRPGGEALLIAATPFVSSLIRCVYGVQKHPDRRNRTTALPAVLPHLVEPLNRPTQHRSQSKSEPEQPRSGAPATEFDHEEVHHHHRHCRRPRGHRPGIGRCGGAAASPFAGSAADTVKTAQAEGYNAQLNRTAPANPTDTPREENPSGTGANPLVATGSNPYVPFYPGNDLAF
jgi:hypothetical protein